MVDLSLFKERWGIVNCKLGHIWWHKRTFKNKRIEGMRNTIRIRKTNNHTCYMHNESKHLTRATQIMQLLPARRWLLRCLLHQSKLSKLGAWLWLANHTGCYDTTLFNEILHNNTISQSLFTLHRFQFHQLTFDFVTNHKQLLIAHGVYFPYSR